MKLPNRAVKRPVTTAMAFMAILLFGVVSMRMLPLDVMPEMELPALTIMTVYPGASAEEVEEQVTKPLEASLSGAENLKQLTSESRENVSIVSLQYQWGGNITEAANNARDLVEQAKADLPNDAHKPVILKVNSSMMPVLIYGITADENYYGIGEIIDNQITTPISQVPGVGSLITFGHPSREIQVNLNPQKMKAYGISIQQLSTILQAENITVPAGNLKIGTRDYALRVPGDVEHLEELKNLVISNRNGQQVRLKDIAEVKDTFKDKDEYARNKYGQGVSMMIQKQSGANTLEVIRGVRKKLEEIQPNLPDDVQMTQIMSTDEIITESISNLTETLFWALLIVVLVVFVFLRNAKSSLIIFLTIPFSLIVAFIVMYAIGYTINIFSLMSLVIAIGMVVDNAIVVLENITQHIERGARPREAAMFGTSEMGMAITASTATTLMVFIPMVFMGGVVGIMFKQLAILTSATMLASLLASLTLTPMVSAQLLKGRKKHPKKPNRLFQASEQVFLVIEKWYYRSLRWAITHRWATLLTALAVFGTVLMLGRQLSTDYIPEFDAGDIAVVIETEVGTSAAETDRVAQKVMHLIETKVPERVDGTISSVAGQTEDGLLSAVGFTEGKNVATLLVHLRKPNEREASAKEIGERLRRHIEQIPEVEQFHITAGSILSAAILGNKKPIEIEISGDELPPMNALATQLQEQMKADGGFTDIATTVDKGKLEIQVHVDKHKASEMALNTAMIANQVRQGMYGTKAGELSEGGNSYDIMVRYEPEFRNKIENMGNMMITNLRGQQVPLSAVAEIREETGLLSLQRKDQQRVVKVMASLKGIALGEATARTRQLITNLDIPPGTEVKLAGQQDEQSESFADLYLILVLGIALVYMVMAAQFESFKDPFIIMFAIPFTFVGIILAFWVTGLTLSVTTFIGVIMLMGIVVNNGIVLVDYIQLLRARGENLLNAVLKGGQSRLRPVLMTSLTTMLGMVPMAATQGMGREMYSPLGTTIIGGMLISTFITLLLVPTIYMAFHVRAARKQEQQNNTN